MCEILRTECRFVIVLLWLLVVVACFRLDSCIQRQIVKILSGGRHWAVAICFAKEIDFGDL